MIKHGPAVPKREGTERWLYEVLRRLQNSSSQAQGGLAAIIRGEAPDGSGRPLFPSLDDYFYLPGRSGGQIGHGATEPGGDLTLSSTKDTSKGSIFLGSAQTSLFDETNERIGLEVAAPSAKLHMQVAAPVGQAPSMTAAAVTFGFGWAPSAGTLLECLGDTDTSDWARYTELGFASHCTCTFAQLTNPGVTSGFTITVCARAVDDSIGSLDINVTNTSGGPQITTFRLNTPTNTNQAAPWVATMTNSFAEYTYTLSAAEVALIDFGSTQNVILVSGFPLFSGGKTEDVAYVKFNAPAVGGGSAETLQTWQTPSYDNSLDFTDDGTSSGTLDLSLSGDTPLRVSSGGGTSGLRLLTSSTNARLEAGTAAAANMNMVLSGTRATQGTQLTLNYINTLLSGSLSVPLGAKTTTYTILATDCVITCNGTFTVTLPTAVGVTGKLYDVKNIGTGVITVATTSSQTVDGGTTATLRVQYESITVISNGSNWEII